MAGIPLGSPTASCASRSHPQCPRSAAPVRGFSISPAAPGRRPWRSNTARSGRRCVGLVVLVLLSLFTSSTFAAVALSNVAPNAAPVTGGTTVVATGSGFFQDLSSRYQIRLRVNTQGVQSVFSVAPTIVLDTQLTFVVPSLASLGITTPFFEISVAVVLNSVPTPTLPLFVFSPQLLVPTTLAPNEAPTHLSTPLSIAIPSVPVVANAVCFYSTRLSTGPLASVPASVTANTSVQCVLPPVNPNINVLADRTLEVGVSLTGLAADILSPPLSIVLRAAAPVIEAAELVADGAVLLIQWTQPVTPRPTSLTTIFDSPSASALNSSTCAWRSTRELLVRLGAEVTAGPGALLTVQGGLFARHLSTFSFTMPAASVSIPAMPDAMAVSIHAPSLVSVCNATSPLHLYASALHAGPVPPTFAWTATIAGVPIPMNFFSFDSISGLAQLALDPSLLNGLSEVTTTLTATAMSLFGGSATSSTTITMLSAVAAPIMRIVGGSHLVAVASQPLRVDVALESACFISTNTANYSFALFVDQALVSVSAARVHGSTFSVWIPETTLMLSSSHVVNITAIEASVGWVASSVSTVLVVSPPTSTAILGGNRTAAAGSPVLMQAVEVNDIGETNAFPNSTMFTWTCSLLNQPSSTPVPCPASLLASGQQVTLTLTAALPSGTQCLISVAVNNSFAMSSATSLLTVVSSPAIASPILTTPVFRTAANLLSLRALSPNAGSGILQWQCITSPVDGLPCFTLSSDTLASAAVYTVGTAVQLTPLIVRRTALLPGFQYSLQASYTVGNLGSQSSVLVSVPFNPVAGRLEVMSTQPLTNLTEFQPGVALVASGFSAAPHALPLRFKFISIDASGMARTIADGLSSVVFDALFPAGTFAVQVLVTDRYGSSVTVSAPSPLIVNTLGGSNSLLPSLVLSLPAGLASTSEAIAALVASPLFPTLSLAASPQLLVQSGLDLLDMLSCSSGPFVSSHIRAIQAIFAALSLTAAQRLAFIQALSAAVVRIASCPVGMVDIPTPQLLSTFESLITVSSLSTRTAADSDAVAVSLRRAMNALAGTSCDLVEFNQEAARVGNTLGAIVSYMGPATTLTAGCPSGGSPVCTFASPSSVSINLSPRLPTLAMPAACAAQVTGSFTFDACEQSECIVLVQSTFDILSNQQSNITLSDPMPMPGQLRSSQLSAFLIARLANMNVSSGLSANVITTQVNVNTVISPLSPVAGRALRCAAWANSSQVWSAALCDTTISGSSVSCSCTSVHAVGVFELCAPGLVGLGCATSCPPGAFGQNCSFRNDCSGHGLAHAVTGQCACSTPGYTGTQCDLLCNASAALAFVSSTVPRFGVRCATNCSCKFNTTCNPIDGTCTCRPGLVGADCGTIVNQCASNPCANGAACATLINDFTCTCPPGYSGKRCNITNDNCVSINCNRGTCINRIAAFYCACPIGMEGVYCERFCRNNSFGPNCTRPCLCRNQGDCDQVDGTCYCRPGYYGRHCEHFLGSPEDVAPVVLPAVLATVGGLALAFAVIYTKCSSRNKSVDLVATKTAVSTDAFEGSRRLRPVSGTPDSDTAPTSGNVRSENGRSSADLFDALAASSGLTAAQSPTPPLGVYELFKRAAAGSPEFIARETLPMDTSLSALRDLLRTSFSTELNGGKFYFLDHESGNRVKLVDERVTQTGTVFNDAIHIEVCQDADSPDFCFCGQLSLFECSRCKRRNYCSSECQKQDWSSHSLKCRAPLTAEQLPVPTMPHVTAAAPTLPTGPLVLSAGTGSAPAAASSLPTVDAFKPAHALLHAPVSLPLNRLSIVSFGTLEAADVKNDYILVQPDTEPAPVVAQEATTTTASPTEKHKDEVTERQEEIASPDEAATAPRASLAESVAEELSGGETPQLDTCYCGQPTLFECSGCGLRGYCSSRCQRKDWARHKAACRANSRRRTSSGSSVTPSTPAPSATPVPFVPVAIPGIRQPLAVQVTSRVLPPVMEVDDDATLTPRPDPSNERPNEPAESGGVAETTLE